MAKFNNYVSRAFTHSAHSEHENKMNNVISQHVVVALDTLLGLLPSNLQRPKLGVICGSGLGGLAETVQAHSSWEISYDKIPHFPTCQGHHPLLRVR